MPSPICPGTSTQNDGSRWSSILPLTVSPRWPAGFSDSPHKRSPTVVGTARSAAEPGQGWVSPTCITPWTTTRGSLTQILSDERKGTAAGFWQSATPSSLPTTLSSRVSRPTTNPVAGQKASLQPSVPQSCTSPPVPTGSKPMARSRDSIARSSPSGPEQTPIGLTKPRCAYQDWLHHYNHRRPRTGIGGLSPIERVSVHNFPGITPSSCRSAANSRAGRLPRRPLPGGRRRPHR